MAKLSFEQRYRGKLGGTHCIHAPFFAAHNDAADFGVLRDEMSYNKQQIELNPPPIALRTRPRILWNDKDEPTWDHIQAMFRAHDTVLYTDGSVEDNPGRGGAAVYGTQGSSTSNEIKLRRSLGGMVTISYAELVAIDMAAVWALSSRPHSRVFLLTDSKYALSVIKGMWKVKKYRSLVASIQAKLYSLRQDCDVRLYKIKSHVNIPGNETVDRLAKQAMHDSSPTPVNPVDYDTAKVLIRRAMVKHWQCQWNSASTQLRSIVPKVTAHRRRHLDKSSRRTSTVITQLATGHYPVAYYLFEKLGHPPSPCACGFEETVEHLLLDCHLHEDLRSNLLDEVEPFTDCDPSNLTLPKLLFDNRNRRKCYNAVLRFLTDIDRLPF